MLGEVVEYVVSMMVYWRVTDKSKRREDGLVASIVIMFGSINTLHTVAINAASLTVLVMQQEGA